MTYGLAIFNLVLAAVLMRDTKRAGDLGYCVFFGACVIAAAILLAALLMAGPEARIL